MFYFALTVVDILAFFSIDFYLKNDFETSLHSTYHFKTYNGKTYFPLHA